MALLAAFAFAASSTFEIGSHRWIFARVGTSFRLNLPASPAFDFQSRKTNSQNIDELPSSRLKQWEWFPWPMQKSL